MRYKFGALAEANSKMRIYRNDIENCKYKVSETVSKYGIDPHFKRKKVKET